MEYTTEVDRKLTQNILIYRERLKSALNVEYMENLLKPIYSRFNTFMILKYFYKVHDICFISYMYDNEKFNILLNVHLVIIISVLKQIKLW